MDTLVTLWDKLQTNLKENGDPRTKDRFLLWSNPIYVWVITFLYLIVAFYGPKFMRDRKPYSLQNFLVVYNLGLVGLSLWMFIQLVYGGWDNSYNLRCAVFNKETWTNPKEERIADALWWYFFSKAIELLDTVLMVLRKKNNQITFLHWFHHASMLNIWWWVGSFLPGGHAFFGAALNCLVHVVMYAYYGLSAIPSLRDKLWWKKYITRFQLIQFFITLFHSVQIYMVKDCDFPRWGADLLTGYMVIMITLFSNFYYQTYINSKRNKKDKVQMNGFHKHD